MFLFRSRHTSLVGLDITANEIRLLQLKREMANWSVENIALAPVPPQAIVDGRIKQFAAVQEIVNTLVAKTRTQGAHAALALPATSVMTQQIKLAAELTPAECEAEIGANLPRYLPGVAEELCFDFAALPTTEASCQEILVVASRQAQLNSYAQLATQAGLQLRIVDVDSYALLRAVRLSLGEDVSQEVVAVLEVQEVMSRFMVFQNHNIIFSHYWEAGELQETAVQRALALFKTAHKHSVIQQIIFSGRISTWQHNLGDYFQTALALTPRIANPFLKMKVAEGLQVPEELAARFLICCGLALRSDAP